MRIVIDLQGAQTESRFRGIGRYSLSLAQAIARNRGAHEVLIALNGMLGDTVEPIRAAFHGLLPQENIRVWRAVPPVREVQRENILRSELAELVREAFLQSLAPDIIYITSIVEGYGDDAVTSIGRFDLTTPVVASMYDLIPLLNAERYLKHSSVYSEHYYRKLEFMKRASGLLAISDSSRQEAIVHLGVSERNIINVSAAADPVFQPGSVTRDDTALIEEKYGIDRPFVLYSGGGDKRKNLSRLVSAFALLPEELRAKYQLVVAGKIPATETEELRSEQTRSKLEPDAIVFAGYVSDEDLVRLYRLCAVFVMPSLHEGFGLPALEAMTCGAAVIGAGTTSMPEVIGRTDALFDPLDVQDIKNRIERVLLDEDFREDLAAHGLMQAKKFSWDLTAKKAIVAFEQIASSSDKQDGDVADAETLIERLTDRIGLSDAANLDDQSLKMLASSMERIVSADRVRQLYVDVSELARRDAKSGVQRVTRTVLKELLANPPAGYTVRPVLAMENRQGYFHANAFMGRLFNNADEPGPDELIEYHPADVFLGLDLQHSTTRAQEGYLKLMREDGVKVVFIVYDLLPILFPQFWPAEHCIDKLHHEWLKVLSQFDGAICISAAVATELRTWLASYGPERLRPFEIGWFHLGADVENTMPTTGMPEDVGLVLEALRARTTFLAVGTIEPRKGYAQILDAFEVLWAGGHDVNAVFIGKRGWLVDDLSTRLEKHQESGKRLFWLEGVSDEYLGKLYQSSNCLIAASYGEGFGLPLIEAAQHGLPLIVRDIPVFREVAGEHAFYFDGMSGEALASAIEEWMRSFHSGTHPSSQEMPWLTWRQSAEQLKAELLRQCSI